jgi:hypothetical protein
VLRAHLAQPELGGAIDPTWATEPTDDPGEEGAGGRSWLAWILGGLAVLCFIWAGSG